jgi:hypothetical protein
MVLLVLVVNVVCQVMMVSMVGTEREGLSVIQDRMVNVVVMVALVLSVLRVVMVFKESLAQMEWA